LSLTVTPPAGNPTYASLAAAWASMPQGLGGSRLQVTASGPVSLLAGLVTGPLGGSLGRVSVQGRAIMVIF
jgi:hypothetical protein